MPTDVEFRSISNVKEIAAAALAFVILFMVPDKFLLFSPWCWAFASGSCLLLLLRNWRCATVPMAAIAAYVATIIVFGDPGPAKADPSAFFRPGGFYVGFLSCLGFLALLVAPLAGLAWLNWNWPRPKWMA